MRKEQTKALSSPKKTSDKSYASSHKLFLMRVIIHSN